MDTTTRVKAKSIAELLPGLKGILSKDAIQTLTAKKQPPTSEKAVKPLTIAEMRSAIMSFNVQSVKRSAPVASSHKKRNWNTSVKVDRKTINHTANGQMKHNPAKKMLNFQTKPKVVTNLAAAMATESPKFPKPEIKAKNSLAFQARNDIRISGINYIADTPITTKTNTKPIKNRMTIANKENVSRPSIQVNTKKVATLKPQQRKDSEKKNLVPIIRAVPDTPLSNISWKSSCDSSFLQKEKEIDDLEAQTETKADERTLDSISKVSSPISTPFKEYRSVQEYFNNSSGLDDSSAMYHDNTIMCFDGPTDCKNISKREESVIVSLCDLLNKATMNKEMNKMSTELSDLLQIENQTEHNIKMITNSICALNNIKESQLKSLQYIRKLISEKREPARPDETLTDNKESNKVVKTLAVSPITSPTAKPCSVIKSCTKSPTYKIPKKNPCLRKSVFHKSMPNVSSNMGTPIKTDMGNRALSVYMKMKEHMNFLNTPIAKSRQAAIPDTPAVTSHNLQKQLDRLYGEQ